ncbi:MAG: DUF3553 domain-containing protein [Myxococcaceae bacterium]
MQTTSAAVYRNDAQPDWGLGLVVEDERDRCVLIFEHGGRKVFVKSRAKGLAPVSIDAAALNALQEKVKGKHASRSSDKPRLKANGLKKAAARFAVFEEQLQLFERLFVGGFESDTFVEQERGLTGAKGKAGYKVAAIAMAKQELSEECFNSASPEDLFAAAKRVLGATNIVYPIEGAIPFGLIAETDRPAVLTGLKDLLHGEGDFAVRLEHFAGSVNLKDKTGKSKRVTWPLATVFGALYAPLLHTCVKPTHFASQGATLGIAVQASQPVTAAGYRQFFEIATETQKRLLAAGHQPRDLVDVYSFIWRTHAEKPA